MKTRIKNYKQAENKNQAWFFLFSGTKRERARKLHQSFTRRQLRSVAEAYKDKKERYQHYRRFFYFTPKQIKFIEGRI